MSPHTIDAIELEMAIDKAGLNAAHRDGFTVMRSGAVAYRLGGRYTLAELTSIVEDMRNVQSAYDRVTR